MLLDSHLAVRTPIRRESLGYSGAGSDEGAGLGVVALVLAAHAARRQK